MLNQLSELYDQKKQEIKFRLEQFKNLPESEYIKEHIFCLLTPQSKAQRCWQAVEEIFELKNPTENQIRSVLIRKTRFHNTKAKRVVKALENWKNIKTNLSNTNSLQLRNLLAEEINGYGLKEASHFLRNIGRSNNQIAILDRHILRNLVKFNILENENIKSKKNYLEIEKKFLEFSNKIKIPIDHLDLLWWSQENGEIFK